MDDVLHAAASALGVKASGREVSGEEQRRRASVVAGLA